MTTATTTVSFIQRMENLEHHVAVEFVHDLDDVAGWTKKLAPILNFALTFVPGPAKAVAIAGEAAVGAVDAAVDSAAAGNASVQQIQAAVGSVEATVKAAGG